ncbi:MAG: HD domain-containing protein [Arcanobacterium sp.]|nr:HD domain-containing protein [Arcanobacterium sp.]
MKTYGIYSDFLSLRAAMEAQMRTHLMSIKKRSEGTRRYRIEHSLRVAAIGIDVAQGAGLDAELLELGCLLHDIGKWDAQKPVDHGRAGALIAEPLLLEAGIDAAEAHEVAQGIAMHTDGLWNMRPDKQGTKKDAHGTTYLTFDAEPTTLARTIGDCDNIDRYSTYRIFDTLQHFSFLELSSKEQKAWLRNYRGTLKEMQRYHCATEVAQKMWIDNLAFQDTYCQRLLTEIEAGTARASATA